MPPSDPVPIGNLIRAARLSAWRSFGAELGPKAQNLALAAVSPLSRGRRVRFAYPLHDQAMIRRLGELLADGRFRPLLDRSYPLEDIVEGYRYAESGRKLGSVVVRVAD